MGADIDGKCNDNYTKSVNKVPEEILRQLKEDAKREREAKCVVAGQRKKQICKYTEQEMKPKSKKP